MMGEANLIRADLARVSAGTRRWLTGLTWERLSRMVSLACRGDGRGGNVSDIY